MQIYYPVDRLKDGLFYVPLTAADDFEPMYPFTAVPIPDGLADPKFDWHTTAWYDASAEAAQQRQTDAEKAAEAAQQKVTLQGKQLEQVTEIVATASSVISQPEVAETISDADAIKLADLWPSWAVGTAYSKGQVVVYNGAQYRYVAADAQAATAEWTPDAVPAIWSPITITADGDTVWRQPTGAQDAYNVDDVVLYDADGSYYKSVIAGNTTVPGTDERFWVKVNKDGSAVK